MNIKPVWTDEYTVHSYEADKRARITPLAMLQYMQESAWNHAEHLGFGYSHLIKKGQAWVLARLALQIYEPIYWHERIILQTWPSGRDRLLAHRDFRFKTAEDKVWALGSTSWIIIDVEKRRPQRTESLADLDNWPKETVFPNFPPKIKAIDQSDSESKRTVYFSHLDVNGHVNNVKYLEYALDSYDADYIEGHFLQTVQMNFLAEAFLGDEVVIKSCRTAAREYLHSLHRKEEGTELCRIKAGWEKI